MIDENTIEIMAVLRQIEDHAKQCSWWLQLIIGLLGLILWRLW
jgi:hypothetical protein